MTLEMESEGQGENCFVIKSSELDNLGVKVKEEEESKVTIFLS